MNADDLIQADKRHLWHPFTPMQDWCAPEHQPLIIDRGEGVWLWDRQGNKYLDGNSSIWTNVHGHNHPVLNAAIQAQLGKIAHSSFLGFTNEPAIHLAEKLVNLLPGSNLSRVFYSDDGSTAIECALKMAVQYWQLQDQPQRCEFLAFDQAYHGDTLGATSLGGISSFHGRFHRLGMVVHHVRDVDSLHHIPEKITDRLAAVIVEPLVQGAAGMKVWPAGMLDTLRKWCDWNGLLLIFDEVMTGFGRTGQMFACQQEAAYPDFLCLAKGLTGGYLPLAATLTTERIFAAFLGRVEEMKTFYYGHSYCGNPLGCAAALANLEIFQSEATLAHLPEKAAHLALRLAEMKAALPTKIGEIRQCGLISGIDVMQDAPADVAYPWQQLMGAKICLEARKYGLLTRPVRDTLVLMPPLSISLAEIDFAVQALQQAVVACT